jgi:hypothetical protein
MDKMGSAAGPPPSDAQHQLLERHQLP